MQYLVFIFKTREINTDVLFCEGIEELNVQCENYGALDHFDYRVTSAYVKDFNEF